MSSKKTLNYADIARGAGHLRSTGATKHQIRETINRETRGCSIQERRQIIREMINNK